MKEKCKLELKRIEHDLTVCKVHNGILAGLCINLQNDRLRFARCYMVLKRFIESAMKPYFIRSY